jgi:hypothetical protein
MLTSSGRGTRARLISGLPTTSMREDQHRFLMLLGQLPARLTAEQAAWVLNCQAHDIPILVSNRLLKPLGNPPPNGIKYFHTSELLESVKDRSWLVKVTGAVSGHWRGKNARRKGDSTSDAEGCLAGLQDLPAGKGG